MSHVAVNSGDLRQRVNLVTRTATVDAVGGPLVTEGVSVPTYAAKIEPATGREYERGGLMTGETTHVITMRHWSVTSALKPKDAIRKGPRDFEIESIENVQEENVYLRFYCKERTGT